MSDSWGEPRSKTISWYEPLAVAERGRSMTGLEFLRAAVAGELPRPPISAHFDVSIEQVEAGRVVFTCTPDESTYNPIGTVHGGLVCTLLDSVIGCAVQSTLPAGVGYTSSTLTVSYLRPVTLASGELRATGTVTKPGRLVAFAEGVVLDAAGRAVASATGSCTILGGSAGAGGAG